ncbi:UNVERIFIED_CONTAM: hypothetical protein NCL1_06643 [Trichonephila clavipes]
MALRRAAEGRGAVDPADRQEPWCAEAARRSALHRGKGSHRLGGDGRRYGPGQRKGAGLCRALICLSR